MGNGSSLSFPVFKVLLCWRRGLRLFARSERLPRVFAREMAGVGGLVGSGGANSVLGISENKGEIRGGQERYGPLHPTVQDWTLFLAFGVAMPEARLTVVAESELACSDPA